MITFPENLFSDVRVEDVHSTALVYQMGEWKVNRIRRETGAFIRVYDGKMWYYSATTDLDKIQDELDGLAAMATPNGDILNDPIVKRHQANVDKVLKYRDNKVCDTPHDRKETLVKHCHDLLTGQERAASISVNYLDEYRTKHIMSSIGCDVEFDYQHAGMTVVYYIATDGVPFTDYKIYFGERFRDIDVNDDKLIETYKTSLDFALNAQPVKQGQYPVILSPNVTGVFAHESFGHKSEADLMLGDENMLKEWAIGSKVGSDILNIYDDGAVPGSGYIPYDDEGNRKDRAWLIKDGILCGRLHSSATAAVLDEPVTGNARAINFEFEPIVRMTGTFIGAGTASKEELFAKVKEGVYIDDYMHGSGMSTFTIAPIKSYMIRDGKIAEPVRVSVITGNVMNTLHLIEGLSTEFKVNNSASGGCGKMEQFPLRVSDGGPYMLVSTMNVQ